MNIQQLEPLWGTWHTTNVIGAGSYGIVYKAQHTVLGRTYTCAVKYISVPRDEGALYAEIGELGTNDPEVLNSYYKQEIESIAEEYDIQMQFSGNPHFVQVYDILSVPKQDMPGYDLLIRMELLNPLRGRFTDSMGPEEKEKEAISLGKDICRALLSMHGCGYLHRDIKPQNILVSDAGVYKLADFGTARKTSGTSTYLSMKGTMDYIAPEIMTGQKAGFSSDLYSLGLVLHYVLNHQHLPFDSSPSGDANVRRLSGEPLPPPEDASPEMAQIILKACAYKPEDRYSDAEAFYSALEQLTHTNVKSTQQEQNKNLPEHILMLRQSASRGDAKAQSRLGYAYETGQGVQQNDEEAIKWFQKAAEQGDALSQLYMGIHYRDGRGVQQDFAKAVSWFQKAANQGYANAQSYLGFAYEKGQGVLQNDEEAIKWFRKAAQQGEPSSINNLGIMYRDGLGVSQNYEEAVHFFQTAAELGFASAQCNLGSAYYYGQGISKNYAKAMEWYRKAAEQGNLPAMHNLGFLYEKGEGVRRNMEDAKYWYNKAAAQGHKHAMDALKRIGDSQ
ncbi:MAG: SEL1-like repeat protein [Clostridia bacterium]|nr:SEL1-like repeat protein [Clostridia bacterium]